LVGRDAELRALDEELSAASSGLVLVIGKPRVGKARILRELRAMAAHQNYRVVPEAEGLDSSPFFVLDRRCSIDEFRIALADPNASGIEAPPTLVAIYGYRPDEDFHAWFTQDFLPSLSRRHPALLIVIGGMSGDVQDLEALARRRLELGPLPRDAVTAELRAISVQIADPLTEGEVERYADAVVDDPALLDALRELLPLTTSETTPEPAIEEG
jgi:hypothetical protein